MNRFAKIVALSLAAVALFACEVQDKVDTGGVILVVSEYDLEGIPAVMSASGDFAVVGSADATLVVRSQARNANASTSQLMDVLIEGYEVRFTRGDTGSATPPTLTEPVGGLVPVNGTMTQNGLIILRQDQFEYGPIRDLRLTGVDPETNSTVVRLIWHLKFYGHTISGERIETNTISFNLDVVP
jgi:hypothetical protein